MSWSMMTFPLFIHRTPFIGFAIPILCDRTCIYIVWGMNVCLKNSFIVGIITTALSSRFIIIFSTTYIISQFLRTVPFLVVIFGAVGIIISTSLFESWGLNVSYKHFGNSFIDCCLKWYRSGFSLLTGE
jgi:hypothetical protein